MGSDNKPLPHKKLRNLNDPRGTLEEDARDKHFVINSYFVIFMVFFFVRTYTVSYDFLLIIPFAFVSMGFLSKTIMFVLMFFIFLYGTIAQFVTWNLWQKRSLNNPNFYWADTVVSSVALSLYTYNMVGRLTEKLQKLVLTLKYRPRVKTD